MLPSPLLSLSRTSREDRRCGIRGLSSGDRLLGLWVPMATFVANSVLRVWWDWRFFLNRKGAGPMRKRFPGSVVFFSEAGGFSCWVVACCLSCLRMVVKRV